jgi:pimeloyl-ACP methyl ester carboxylesterase
MEHLLISTIIIVRLAGLKAYLKWFQVIGIDFRGYGESDKSNDSNFYGTTNLVNDVINLIDHLKLENIRLIGYSMGTVIALDLLSTHPEYFSKAVLIATGDGLIGLPLYI